ncbi:MAG: hypothetical protein KTR20_04010 [Cellvibrionaceae bacterium]|nr:hypothetical protein [Cellvibrionaceae bacterium]
MDENKHYYLIRQKWHDFLHETKVLKVQLVESSTVLIDNLKPIWSDPLWQFLGLIFLAVIVLLAIVYFFKTLSRWLFEFLKFLKIMASQGLVVAFQFLVTRYKNSRDKKKQALSKDNPFWLNPLALFNAFKAVRYLTTRRDWRYNTSWYLLTGTDAPSRKSWLESVTKGRRTELLVREKKLIDPHCGWHFFDNGLIIDVENDAHFSTALQTLNDYRPERPLDGILLTVSAEQLLNADSTIALHNYGQTLYEKMWQLQKVTGFILPVYLIVSNCEQLEGFEAFWSAWDEKPSDTMFGWSNPARIDTAFSISWVKDAFATITAAIKKAQLTIASQGKDIADIDGFILFDRAFKNLQAPLSELVKYAFARSSFQEALPLRGIWFSGKDRHKISLTEDFFSQKLWPEKNIAYPISQRYFSFNRRLRRTQYFFFSLFFIIMLWSLIDTFNLWQYNIKANKIWSAIAYLDRQEQHKYEGAYDHGDAVWKQLNSLTQLANHPNTWALPWSWGKGQLAAMSEKSASRVFGHMLFPGYDKRLIKRAKALKTISEKPINANDSVLTLSNQLSDYANKLINYRQAKIRFRHLAGPLPNEKGVAEDLRKLTDYLYDEAIPDSIDFTTPLILNGVMGVHYDIEWRSSSIIEPTLQAAYLTKLSAAVREKIQDKTLQLPLDELIHVFSQAKNFTRYQQKNRWLAVNKFQNWMKYIAQQWLVLDNDNNPCAGFYKKLQGLYPAWNASGYATSYLDKAVLQFNTENCYVNIRDQLKNLKQPFVGQLFTEDDDGNLQFSAALTQWQQQFAALDALHLFSYQGDVNGDQALNYTADSQKTASKPGKIVAWNAAPLQDAIDILFEFQAFRQRWWHKGHRSTQTPFYALALRDHLQQLIAQLLVQAEQRDYSYLSDATKIANDQEAQLSASINSFTHVDSLLRQLQVLLQQEGDQANLTLVKNHTRQYINDQLSLLTTLVEQNKLYAPIGNALALNAAENNSLATLFFSYKDPVALGNYLENQRQRLAFLAQNYAQPLVSYLNDTDTIAKTNNHARLWYSTLVELKNYARQQPTNAIKQLQDYIGQQLSEQNKNNCHDILQSPQVMNVSGGLFAQHHYDLNRDVRNHCRQFESERILRRYLALAERFNHDLKGKFPFTDYSGQKNSPHKNVSLSVLNTFFDDYQHLWGRPDTEKPLLLALQAYVTQHPEPYLKSWLAFVKKIDRFSQFYQKTKTEDGSLQVRLAIEFDSRSPSSHGQNQIVQWIMHSASEAAVFPNGINQLVWQPGHPLSLSLRWAKGSEFTPLASYGSPQKIDALTRMAQFHSEGPWALFEWLQRYSKQPGASLYQNQLQFSVPVGAKADAVQMGSQVPAYISRVNLALSAVIIDAQGREKTIAIPDVLPRFAPGLPDEIAYLK